MSKNVFEIIKRLFREWYGSLSVEELTSNHELIEVIQRIEARLVQATA